MALPAIGQRQPKQTTKPSILEPYQDYLVSQWNAGRQQAKQLFYEIEQQGYTGSYGTLARFIQRMKRSYDQGQQQQLDLLPSSPLLVSARQRLLTARRASWLIVQPGHKRSQANQALLEYMTVEPELAEAIELSQSFAKIVRERLPKQFDAWLNQATGSTIRELKNFSEGLREDYEAVKAGVTVDVSNGQVEGQNNRLKMLKRQMYGRAGLDLLRRRFLLAA